MTNTFINLKALSKRIAEVKEELAHLLHLESFAKGGSSKKRGRPAKKGGLVETGKLSKKRNRKVGKRGALGKKILSFLSSKGKEGAHVKEIATHAGTKPANVTAWTYTTGKGKVKKIKPATFAIKE